MAVCTGMCEVSILIVSHSVKTLPSSERVLPKPLINRVSFYCNQGNRMSRQNSQQGGGLHPGQSQRQWSNSLSKQASFERKDSCSGLMTNDTSFSWDYIEPQAGGKDFLGQRKKDVRSSLDWDFQNELPLAVTRRSKEYGEERPRNPMGGLVAAGRSYSGSMSDHGSMV